MSEIVRVPQQQRSIDKKNRIIEAGYQLFAEKGYYNISTVDIAKRAKVSTGIVYGYFHNKHDILCEVFGVYADNIYQPVLSIIDNIKQPINFNNIIPKLLDEAVAIHVRNADIHQALHSLAPTDKEIDDKFLQIEGKMTQKIVLKLQSLGYENSNMVERVHLAMETMQSYSHEFVYDKHPYIDYSQMHDMVVMMIKSLFIK